MAEGHHIYCCSPVLERSKEAIFKISRDQGVPVWKVRRVNAPGMLEPGELYVTHYRISNEIECAHALAALGCSEVMLVVEGIIRLEVEYNQGSSPRTDARLRTAISRTGARLFWEVAHSVASKYPDNLWLQKMLASDDARFQMIAAWSHVFTLRTERLSHPYNVIRGDLEIAAKALGVLHYVAQKCEENKVANRRNLSHLLRASLPFVEASVASHKKEVRRREEEESEAEMKKRLLLQ
ncbi:hypothetical protein SELMODRAFT_449158 [Selaginella moellendorffii]|uniref:Uncharacterized protein n=1 Tax=Selaginella moellendorffii TaxID=88036 RepID=D8TD78_SELML|nr:hypothetical protein SELMODRAFT_449158 [Selaginella moellendorffii]